MKDQRWPTLIMSYIVILISFQTISSIDFEAVFMIPLSRDGMQGGMILMYWNKSPGLNESSHHH